MQLSRRLRRRVLTALAPMTVLASALLAVPASAAAASSAPAPVVQPGHMGVLQPSAITASGVRVYHVTKTALLAGIHSCFDLGFAAHSNAHAVYVPTCTLSP